MFFSLISKQCILGSGSSMFANVPEPINSFRKGSLEYDQVISQSHTRNRAEKPDNTNSKRIKVKQPAQDDCTTRRTF